MPFESTKNKQPHERAVFFVPRDELVAKQFEELLIVTGFGELPGFLPSGVHSLADLLLEDGAIQLLLRIEVPEYDCLIDPGVRRQVPGRGSSKSVLRKYLDRCFDDVLPLGTFLHK